MMVTEIRTRMSCRLGHPKHIFPADIEASQHAELPDIVSIIKSSTTI
jgi:hypothetical protein